MKRLRESVEHLSNLVSTLEVKNIELENAKKLRGQEIEFKDRCVGDEGVGMGLVSNDVSSPSKTGSRNLTLPTMMANEHNAWLEVLNQAWEVPRVVSSRHQIVSHVEKWA